MSIEGIQFQVSSAELSELLSKSIDYHAKRAEAYESQAALLGENSRGDSFDNFASRGKSHRANVTQLTFMRDHLVPNEAYMLRDHDLNRLLSPGDWD